MALFLLLSDIFSISVGFVLMTIKLQTRMQKSQKGIKNSKSSLKEDALKQRTSRATFALSNPEKKVAVHVNNYLLASLRRCDILVSSNLCSKL